MRVGIMRLPHAADLPLPSYQSASAAGLDLAAALGVGAVLVLPSLGRALVPTGLVFEIPQGYEGQVRPRSGLAVKSGVTVLNAPGTVDADFRGEVKVALVNLGDLPFTVTHGMRIAQLVLARVERALIEPASAVAPTVRGAGGFGSTGLTS